MRAREFISELHRVEVHNKPDWVGAYVDDRVNPQKVEPITKLPIHKISELEPDSKFSDPKFAANLEKIVGALKAGKELPPIIVRRIGKEFQVVDGHHRFKAHRMLGKKFINARIVDSGRVKDINEQEVDEMALPADWDPTALGHDKTFKSRLDYALQRAPRLGGGSSRVAFVIPDQGRETVLKIAKNNKGLAQNQAEADILDDGYLGKLDIVIPLVDYDKTSREPVWIQTEKANKVSRVKLAKMLHAGGKWPMTNFLYAVENKLGSRQKYMPSLDDIKKDMLDSGSTEQDIEIFMDYVDQVAVLVSSSSLLAGDFGNPANWGEYQGRPVIIDLGYTESVHNLYWKR